ncbi:MAG: rRNA maturation RNase YbeY [Labilithrix sp.]|nr:rRNA maturation RNase YbeY [Labilithrix sp.]
MIGALQLRDREVSFLLTDDKRIHQLNKVYRDKDRPTDVLAFAMQEGELAELAGGVLGDVIVSVPTAKKQADERGASLLDEVTMLLAHGLLHLLGWDHRTPAEDRRMRAETDRLCRAARPVGPAEGGAPRVTASAPEVSPRRSKGGAERALSRNRSTVQRPSRGEKVQARHQVKARRSRKG